MDKIEARATALRLAIEYYRGSGASRLSLESMANYFYNYMTLGKMDG